MLSHALTFPVLPWGGRGGRYPQQADGPVILRRLAHSLEAKYPYTHGHSHRVAVHAARVARKLGLDPEQVAQIEMAGLFHDIGKIGLRESVLRKPARLTDAEYEHVKTHCVLGAQMLGTMGQGGDVLAAVRHHHERHDGTGYPDGRRREVVPLGARILAVCDAFDAMTSHRPYRRAESVEYALAEIERGGGSQFDPHVADTFLAIHSACHRN